MTGQEIERKIVWAMNRDFIQKASRPKNTVGSCLKKLSYLGWNSGFFFTKRGENKVKHFLVPSASRGNVLISSFMQLYIGGPGQDVS